MTNIHFINTPQRPRDHKGRFKKGIRYSILTEFKKGEHWRSPKLYWDKDWLYNEYVIKRKSSLEIAKEQDCGDTNILFFLNKFNIKTRSISDTRKIKHWGLSGEKNGMYNRKGELNPNWNGGHSPERQRYYCQSEWKILKKSILKRDNYKCQNCFNVNTTTNRIEIHHMKPWSKYPELRFDPNNLLTICHNCHKQIKHNAI